MGLSSRATLISGGLVGMGSGRFEIAINSRISASLTASGQRWTNGSYALRDGFLDASFDVINEPSRVLRVKPGLTLPLGTVTSDTSFSPMTTGSFDPWLQLEGLVGGTWIGGLNLTLRAPVYRGTDGVRQGTRLRIDAKGARRTARGVGWAGVTSTAQTGGEVYDSASIEVEVAGGWFFDISDRWGLGLDVRIPVYQRTAYRMEYIVAGGLSVTRVNRGMKPAEEIQDPPGDADDHGAESVEISDDSDPAPP